jgi:hypothetical protein
MVLRHQVAERAVTVAALSTALASITMRPLSLLAGKMPVLMALQT